MVNLKFQQLKKFQHLIINWIILFYFIMKEMFFKSYFAFFFFKDTKHEIKNLFFIEDLEMNTFFISTCKNYVFIWKP